MQARTLTRTNPETTKNNVQQELHLNWHEVLGPISINSCLRNAIPPWYQSGKVSQSSAMHSLPKFFLFLSCLLCSGVYLFAEKPGKLALIYRVDNENIEITGFENKIPYFLREGEKVFPESGGKWFAEGDFETLVGYAYLPDQFALNLKTRSYKQRNNPRSYTLALLGDTIPLTPHQNTYLYWDESKLDNSILVGVWIGPEDNPARIAYIGKEYFQNLGTDTVGGHLVRESDKQGHPAFWLLDPMTLQVQVPQADTHNVKARLNWLMKAGLDREVIKAWNSNSSLVEYTNGEVNPLHLMATYGRENLLPSMPGLEQLSQLRDIEWFGIGNYPGHYAASVGNHSFFKFLQQPELAVSSSNMKGYYPVHLAIQYGHLELTRWLVDTFSLENKKRKNREGAPIEMALNFRRHEIFDFLSGFNTRSLSFEKASLTSLFSGLCRFGRTSMVKYLLAYEPDLLDDSGKFDAFESAIRSGNPEVLKLVLEKVETLGFQKPESKMTYLHVAARYNEAEMIPLLIAKGISIDSVTKNGVSPLYLAVTSGGLEATLKLIEYGANPDLTPADDVSAIWAATYLGKGEEIQSLIEAGASCELNPDFANTMVEYATLFDLTEVVQIALDQGLAPDYQLFEEFSGIYVAEFFGSDGVRRLLEAHGQRLDESAKPNLIAARDLDSPLKFIKQPKPFLPADMAEKYGILETKVWAIFNKEGKLILPKFEPALPTDLTKHIREVFKQWRIVPPMSGGQPANLLVKFPFKLEKEVKKEEIYEISALNVPPKPIKQVAPRYPPELKRNRVEGEVEAVFVVLEDGSIDDLRIKSMSNPAFAKSLVEAVKQWKFEPGIKDGRPVKTRMHFPMSFSLRSR